jgi:hypothetical protein
MNWRNYRWPHTPENDLLPWWLLIWGLLWVGPFYLCWLLAAIFYGIGRLSIEDSEAFWNQN